MARIAILYDTHEGQTERIARFIGEVIERAGDEARADNIHELPAGFPATAFDGFIVGGSVHGGRHSHDLIRFIRNYRTRLIQKPAFFFSVSLCAAGKTDEQQQHARDYLEALLRQTDWRPRRTATFAVALLYQDYNWIIRWVIKRIAGREGGDTDTSRNYEYTDWEQVEAFARQCADDVKNGNHSG